MNLPAKQKLRRAVRDGADRSNNLLHIQDDAANPLVVRMLVFGKAFLKSRDRSVH